MWLLFQKQEIPLAQKIGRRQSAHPAADDDNIMSGRSRRSTEDFAIPHLMTNQIIFALNRRRSAWLSGSQN